MTQAKASMKNVAAFLKEVLVTQDFGCRHSAHLDLHFTSGPSPPRDAAATEFTFQEQLGNLDR